MEQLEEQRKLAAERASAGAEIARRANALMSGVAAANASASELMKKCGAYRAELERELDAVLDAELVHMNQRLAQAAAQQTTELMPKYRARVVEAEKKVQQADQALQECRAAASALGGKLAAMQEAADAREAARKALAKKWNFDASNAEAAQRVLRKMEGLLAKAREDLASGRKPLDDAVAEAAAQLSAIQSERILLSKTEAQTRQDVKSVEREIEAKRALGGAKVRFFFFFFCLLFSLLLLPFQKASIEQQLEKSKQELAVAQKELGNVKEFELAVEELQSAKNASEKLLSSLSEQIVGASQVDAANERLKAARQQVSAKEAELNGLVDRHGAALQRLLNCAELPFTSLGAATSSAAEKARAKSASLSKRAEELRGGACECCCA